MSSFKISKGLSSASAIALIPFLFMGQAGAQTALAKVASGSKWPQGLT